MPQTVHDVHIPQHTIGISPKVIAATLTALAGYALTKLAIPWNPALEQLVNLAAVIAAAYLAPPGAVPRHEIGPANDDLLELPELPELPDL